MPVSARISDAELRQRLEDHAYNVPPITDTTRAILIKKLNQLDSQRSSNARKQGTYSGLDYSSAEDDEIAPTPIANSTRRGTALNAPSTTSKNGHSGNKRGARQNRGEVEVLTGVTSRVTRSSRSNSRAGTPHNGGGGSHVQTRRNVSLMTHSETEEGSEEEEDEEEDIEEEEEEEESEEEEEVNGVDRVDLAVQTSLMDSPSPTRFRGQRLMNTSYSPTSQASNYTTTPTFPIMSPYLRKNINKHGSLNEALSTLPSPKSKPMPCTPDSTTSPSPTTQTSPRPHSSPHSQSYSRDTNGPCSYMIVSSLIMAVAASFFLFLLVQYLSLVPPHSQSSTRVPVCGGLKGELPRIDCVPSSELNQTVELYKILVKLLPSAKGCMEEQTLVSRSQALEQLSVTRGEKSEVLKKDLDNLLVLLRQNPGWGIVLEEEKDEETRMGLARNISLACSVYKWGVQVLDLVWQLAWVIMGIVVVALVLAILYKLTLVRRARIKKKDEEVFQLVRQATNFLYQQHQMASREGKVGPTYLAINHIRDQLIPPQDRQAKAGVWGEVVDYVEKNESRVRQDVQKIFGEDFRVWQWLPESHWSPSSSSPSGPSSPPPSHSTPASSSSSSNPWPHVPTTQGTVGWQGCAFPLGKHVAAPLAPPTSCLKVRHMFDVLQQGPGWVKQVKDEIIRRCGEADILHIAVDTHSEEGTVYIKTAGMEDAGKVFRCLHGQWYRGQLVTAKYLRLERYHERFPDAKTSSVPMKIGK